MNHAGLMMELVNKRLSDLERELRWIRKWHEAGELPIGVFGSLDDWRKRVDGLFDIGGEDGR